MAKINCLSDEIIYGTPEGVKNWLEQGAVVNEIDAYGFTPLIQTTIVNNTQMAALVLQKGAEVNEPDLTGRCALHWAADNNNYELCKLLLQRQADPNAYTVASQPVLVSPLLRGQKRLKQLFYDHKADLNFAQDFINTKLLGHRYELQGYVDIVNHKGQFIALDFAGFYLEFTLGVIQHSLKNYQNNFASRALRGYFKYLKQIMLALNAAAELIRYQHYLVDIAEHQLRINSLLSQDPLIIPIAYEGHAITLIKCGPWIARCDRGEQGRLEGCVVISRIGKRDAWTKELIKSLIYKKQNKEFIHTELPKILGLERIKTLPIPPQITGNCSWANVEACIPTLLYLLQMQESQLDFVQIERTSMHIYQHWLEWEREMALHECIARFDQASPARKASIATILAALIYQNCEAFLHHDLDQANKIIPLLIIPEYQYILKSYVQAYGLQPKDAKSKAFMDLLDICGAQLD